MLKPTVPKLRPMRGRLRRGALLIGVGAVALLGMQSPSLAQSAEQVLAVVRRYLPEEAAQAFVAAELTAPSATLVLFTIRPDRWLTADFSGAQ